MSQTTDQLDAVSTREELAAVLTALRERAGMTVRDVAKAADVPVATVGGYFSGRHIPPVAALAQTTAVLRACGVPDEELDSWLDAIARVRRAPGPRPGTKEIPYRGLAAFQPEDAAWFFGRETLTATLLDRVRAAVGTPVIVVGASGAGKSSLLRAGLVPAVAELEPAGSGPEGTQAPWAAVLLTPGAHPSTALATALSSAPDPGRTLLVVDQLEEVFTSCPDADERASFVAALVDLAAAGTRVVLGLRADFYGEALRHPALGTALAEQQVIVGPMTPGELRRAIVQPALLAQIELDPGLVEVILDDLAAGGRGSVHDPGALPMLSHSLYETWRLGGGRRLTVADYVESGGIAGAVAATAERLYARLSREEARAVANLFLRLVHVGQDVADTRRRVDRLELADLDQEELLESLIEARLLTADSSSVQIAHESLLSAWPRLRGWIDHDRDGLLVHRELAASAAAWVRAEHDPSMLYRAGRLERATEWAAETRAADTMNAQEHAFLETSTAAADAEQASTRRRTRRLRTLVATLSALVLAVVGVSGYSLDLSARADRERDLAVSRQLAEAANRIRAVDPIAAAQLAVLGFRTAPTAESRGALLDASAVPAGTRVMAGGSLPSLALSGDARWMAAGASTGDVRVWQLSDAAEPVPTVTVDALHADDEPLYATALDGDGRRLATAGASGWVHLWSLAPGTDPTLLADLDGGEGTIFALAFSPDGTSLAAAGEDGQVRLWDLTADLTADPAVLDDTADPLASVAFSADGTTLAAAGSDLLVHRWDLREGVASARALPPLAGPARSLTSVAFAPDGHALAAGSKDQVAYTWALDDPWGAPTADPVTYEDGGSWINAVGYSPDGSLVATGSSDHDLRIYEVSTGILVSEIPQPGPITALTFLSTGNGLVTSGPDGSLRLWPEPTPAAALPGGRAFSVHFDPNGRLVAAGSANAVRTFDVSVPYRAPALGPAVSAPDGGTFDGTAAYSASGDLLATGSGEGPVWLWDTSGDTMRLLSAMPDPPTALVEGVAFSPDGRTLSAASDDSTVRLWDITDPTAPEARGVIDSPPSLELWATWSPDSSLLAIGGAGPDVVTIWDVSDPADPQMLGEPLEGLALQSYGMIFSPDGQTLAVASADRTVRLADVSEPATAHWIGAPLLGAGDYVYDVAFSPDGSMLASVSGDGVLRTWDVTDRQAPVLTASLTAAGAGLYSISISPDGSRIAAGGTSSTVTIWDLDPAAVTARVCRLVGTALTEAEWQQYVPSITYQDPCAA